MTQITLAQNAPEREILHPMLVEYYNTMIPLNPPEIAAQLDANSIAAGFWDEVEEYLPPTGCMALAHDDQGALLGGGMMRTIRPQVAEFKRMFVRPQARGLGLGRKLIATRLDAARRMGIKTVLADTLQKTVVMQALYDDFGFKRIARYPESHSAIHFPALVSQLRYFQLDL